MPADLGWMADLELFPPGKHSTSSNSRVVTLLDRSLFVEVDRWRAERRLSMRQIDVITDNLDEALSWIKA